MGIIDWIKVDPAWQYREANVSHLGPLVTPEPVAIVLLDLIDGCAGTRPFSRNSLIVPFASSRPNVSAPMCCRRWLPKPARRSLNPTIKSRNRLR
jgi:hypothetical protein